MDKKLDATPEGLLESMRLLAEMAKIVEHTKTLPNDICWTRTKSPPKKQPSTRASKASKKAST
jgi:hypothetical protein